MVSEYELADRIGVTRDALTAVRRSLLKKNVGWKKQGRVIMITDRGTKQLIEYFRDSGLTIADFTEPGEKTPAIELTVKTVFPNRRLLLCTTQDGRQVRVQVPTNVNFRQRMKLKALPPKSADGPQLYRLEGRCPRFPGRW